MTPPDRPSITPELVQRFLDYYRQPDNGAWGSLHIVLDDGNVQDDHVAYCVSWAEERSDTEGAALARILLTMSKSQRSRIPNKVHALSRLQAEPRP